MKLPRGIRRDRHGYRAAVRVGLQQRHKRFHADATLKQMKDWRDDTKVALRALKPVASPSGSLEAEIARYLLQVAAMPTIGQRTEHLQMWSDALGKHTPRLSISPEQIRVVLHGWRTAGYSAATCNKRRTALMHLFTILDGKDARNPVRAVPKFRVSDPLPRGRDPHTIDAALVKAPRCRSRASARVMLWTGMRPVELDRAEPDDVDLHTRVAIVRTAKGGRTRVVPLTTQGVSAWREFIAADAWHRVPKTAPFNRWLKSWTGLPDLRVYDLRHSYGTALATRQTRLDVIGALMGHSTLDLTRRYTLAAVTPDAQLATTRLAKGRRTAKKLPDKVAHRPKSQ